MAVKGLINALHLKERVGFMTEDVMIYALPPSENPATPIEWIQEVINHQKFGDLPPTDELPVNRFVGAAKIFYKADADYSIWTKEPPTPSYIVGDTCVLDEPSDASLKEVKRWKCLPQGIKFHSFEPAMPHFRACDIEIIIPANDELYDQASQGKYISFEFSGKLAQLMTDRSDGSLIPFNSMRLVNGKRWKRYYYLPTIEEELVDGTPKRYPSVLSEVGRSNRKIVTLDCIARNY